MSNNRFGWNHSSEIQVHPSVETAAKSSTAHSAAIAQHPVIKKHLGGEADYTEHYGKSEAAPAGSKVKGGHSVHFGPHNENFVVHSFSGGSHHVELHDSKGLVGSAKHKDLNTAITNAHKGATANTEESMNIEETASVKGYKNELVTPQDHERNVKIATKLNARTGHKFTPQHVQEWMEPEGHVSAAELNKFDKAVRKHLGPKTALHYESMARLPHKLEHSLGITKEHHVGGVDLRHNLDTKAPKTEATVEETAGVRDLERVALTHGTRHLNAEYKRFHHEAKSHIYGNRVHNYSLGQGHGRADRASHSINGYKGTPAERSFKLKISHGSARDAAEERSAEHKGRFNKAIDNLNAASPTAAKRVYKKLSALATKHAKAFRAKASTNHNSFTSGYQVMAHKARRYQHKSY